MLEHFKEFKAHAGNRYGKMIKILCKDNGGEYVNKDVQNLCGEADIQLQNIVPYIPQWNEVAKRKN